METVGTSAAIEFTFSRVPATGKEPKATAEIHACQMNLPWGKPFPFSGRATAQQLFRSAVE
jgi:hypothetical protein